MAHQNILIAKAIFIGQSGSLGYIKGIEYNLVISINTNQQLVITNNDNINSNKTIPYGSLKTFLNNWMIL